MVRLGVVAVDLSISQITFWTAEFVLGFSNPIRSQGTDLVYAFLAVCTLHPCFLWRRVVPCQVKIALLGFASIIKHDGFIFLELREALLTPNV